MPAFAKHGARALTADFAFWSENWTWARTQAEFKVTAPLEYAVKASVEGLALTASATVRRAAERSLVWQFDLDARSTTRGVPGGGIAFKFDLDAFRKELGEPELLSGNAGWSWGKPGGSRLEMRFEPPVAELRFEKGGKSELRAYFYRDEVPEGRRSYKATLTFSGDGMVGKSLPERFGLDDPLRWPAGVADPAAAPVNLAFLNAGERPAGKRGFLTRRGDRLAFEDGTPARFWGTNLTAAALFRSPKESVKAHAQRLSQLGFNLVRLHHHDSHWVVPNVFGERDAPDTRTLRTEMLEHLDWWIACLKAEGIYVWLDLHVGRRLTPGDGIDDFAELPKGKAAGDLRGYNYVNGSIQRAMARFNEAYVGHLNAHTGLRYRDDPAIIAMLVTNENDVTHHFGNVLLPNRNVPRHNALYMARAQDFAVRHGLAREATWRSWEPGPAKLFLNDLERQFHAGMIAQLRALGVKVPIATTSSWGFNPLSSLPALTVGDIVDVHAYGGPGELERSPLYGATFGHWIASAQVAGRPLTVSEWNVSPFPVAERHAAPLYIASLARLQGWAAVLQYAYAQVPLNTDGAASNWHAFNDPAMLATLPAAALLYRQGHVREASTIYAFAPSKERLFHESISPRNAVALRTAAERGRLVVVMPAVKELPWLEAGTVPAAARRLTDPAESLLREDATEATSDSGELKRDWASGVYSVDTPMSQAATGWIGGRRIALRDVEIDVVTPNASVAVQSLDGQPLVASRRILISLGARSEPRQGTRLPFLSEPVTGSLMIRAPRGLKLHTKAGEGASGGTLPYADGRYRVDLTPQLATYWLLLQ